MPAQETVSQRLRVVTWNIHGCIDQRGRFTPERTARVIRWLRADVVALQEANLDAEPGRDRLLQALGDVLPYWRFEPTHERDCRHRPGEVTGFGNLLLSRWPMTEQPPLELTHGLREPRLALRTRLATPAGSVHCWVIHFGLGVNERRSQGRRVASAIARLPREEPLILTGDFNEWLPRARSLRALHRQLVRLPARRSFPARRPLLALDQVWIRGPLHPHRVNVIRDPILHRISDHLPVVADLTLASD